jgi:hypothetical protein
MFRPPSRIYLLTQIDRMQPAVSSRVRVRSSQAHTSTARVRGEVRLESRPRRCMHAREASSAGMDTRSAIQQRSCEAMLGVAYDFS